MNEPAKKAERLANEIRGAIGGEGETWRPSASVGEKWRILS